MIATFSIIAVDDVTPRCGPSREGRDCCPAPILAFVNTWVSAPPRTVITRPEYVAQYNGVGECPF